MTISAVERFLVVKPFKPFNLRTSDGEAYRIVSPESIRLMPNLDLVVVYPPDGSLVMLDPLQVTSASYTPKKPAKA